MRFFPWLNDRFQQETQEPNSLDVTPQARDSLCKALRADNIESVTVRAEDCAMQTVTQSSSAAIMRGLRDVLRDGPPEVEVILMINRPAGFGE
jgi:hypothetical protein